MFVDIHGVDIIRRGRKGGGKVDFGVEVPGIPSGEYGLMPGLLFADDLVGLADNIVDLQHMADRVSDWCDRWDMKVGIKKCGWCDEY